MQRIGLKEGQTMVFKPACHSNAQVTGRLFMVLALCLSPVGSAQDRDSNRDRDRNRGNDTIATVERGTVIPVRINEAIDVDRSDNRVYTVIVDKDIRGEDGRSAI